MSGDFERAPPRARWTDAVIEKARRLAPLAGKEDLLAALEIATSLMASSRRDIALRANRSRARRPLCRRRYSIAAVARYPSITVADWRVTLAATWPDDHGACLQRTAHHWFFLRDRAERESPKAASVQTNSSIAVLPFPACYGIGMSREQGEAGKQCVPASVLGTSHKTPLICDAIESTARLAVSADSGNVSNFRCRHWRSTSRNYQFSIRGRSLASAARVPFVGLGSYRRFERRASEQQRSSGIATGSGRPIRRTASRIALITETRSMPCMAPTCRISNCRVAEHMQRRFLHQIAGVL